MAMHRVTHTEVHYGAMVAKRLRELRDDKGWSIDDFRDRLKMHGVCRPDGSPIPTATAYSYEQGKDNGGADLPMNMVPVIGKIYGYSSPHGWLPREYPDEQ